MGKLAETERAAAAIAEAMAAVRDQHRNAYAKLLTELAGERTAAWTAKVSERLVALLRTSVTRAWRAGWQPAELIRHAGRELSRPHAAMTVDMIVAELRTYPAATVHPQWAAQVTTAESAALHNGSWQGSDADYLGAWAKQSAAVGGLRDAIATAIELVDLLQRLPILERLLPLPGTAPAPPAPPPAPPAPPPAPAPPNEPTAPTAPSISGALADKRLLGRIRALLAKAEATEYADEAEALSARAQELMSKYSIDQALLAAGSPRTGQPVPTGRRIPVDGPYEGPKTSLLQAVATANRCRVVWSKEVGLATVVGFEADLDVVDLLFTSLLVQANTAMRHAGTGGSRTKAYRQSFLVSYAIRIGERLEETAAHATQEAAAQQEATRTALVPFLAARQKAVDDAVDEIFGATLRRGRSVRITDEDGWTSGRAAADQASLHDPTRAVDRPPA